MAEILAVRDIHVSFGDKQAVRGVSLSIEQGRIYAIIGPNGSGKTTLLRTMSRNLKPASGVVTLEGKNLSSQSAKTIARRMAVVSQLHGDTQELTVQDLVAYGRYAHRPWWQSMSLEDRDMVSWALARTRLEPLAHRKLPTLSGGERQRAWIAMAIAQKPRILLLDEPTTFLDIGHQLEVLELLTALNREEGITIVMVLHDINHAARYADELIVLSEGKVFGQGPPWTLLRQNVLGKVFKVTASVTRDEETGKPLFYAKSVIPQEEKP